MGLTKPIEQYLCSNLLNLDTYILYLKDIIRGVTEMKIKKKMKKMLEANLMNVILTTEQKELKKLMIHFLETL